MRCTETGDLLSEYIDDELAAPSRAGVEAHLAACAACRERHRALRRTVRFVQAHAGALPDVTRPGADYARFTRAMVDDSVTETPEQVLAEALRGFAPGIAARMGQPEARAEEGQP